MFSLLKKLFRVFQTKKNFRFLIVDRPDEIDKNCWYRMRHWDTSHYLRMDTNWDRDWKTFLAAEPVVGVTFEDRQRKFIVMGDLPDFRIYLQKDPRNPHDNNAIKVMASATVSGVPTVEQLGFLSRETAESLKDEKKIDARPYSVFLPYQESRFGLKIRVLTRSQVYRKKTGQPTTPRKKKTARKAIVEKRDVRKRVFDEVYDWLDDAREDYDCKKVAKRVFKQVFDEFFDDALGQKGVSEEQLNAEGDGSEWDVADGLIEALDDIVDRLFIIQPELRRKE